AEVARTAQTVVVGTAPGLGDEVQAIKAGILEIADVFVVNKADRDGADAAVLDLEQMLHLGAARSWNPPVLKTVGTRGEGLADLAAAVEAHQRHLATDPEGTARLRARQ